MVKQNRDVVYLLFAQLLSLRATVAFIILLIRTTRMRDVQYTIPKFVYCIPQKTHNSNASHHPHPSQPTTSCIFHETPGN